MNERTLQISWFTRLLQGLGVYAVFLVLLAVGALVSPEFLSPHNLLGILQMVSLLGIVAVGVAFITYGGHYADLSIPAIMALTGFVTVSALPLGFVPALVCGLAAGMLVGLINGLVVGYLRLNPIIWTLAMAFLLDGVLRWIYSGNQVYPDASQGPGWLFSQLTDYRLVRFIPLVTVVMILLTLASHWLMKRTRFGGQVQLTGAAYEVARLSGVNVRSVVMRTFLLSSLTSAVAGVFATSLNKLGGFEVGKGFDFDSVTAVVLGGVMLTGGRGSVLGVFGGVLVMGLLSNIMDLGGVAYEWKLVVTGAVFISVVASTSYFDRKAGRADG